MNFVNQFEIVSSWDKFTDTARIEIPREIVFQKEKTRIEQLIKVGDTVSISAGYFPEMNELFVGFVSAIKPDVVTKIECQDHAYLCKHESVDFSGENVTIKSLLNEIIPSGIKKVNAIDAEIGSMRVKNSTVVQVLDKLKKTYGVRAWFTGDELNVGLPHLGQNGTKHDISFQRDIPIGESSLEYVDAENVKIKIKAVSMLPDNSKIETETGDPNGETRTFTTYNVKSVSELKKLADQHLDQLKFSGFRGSFTMFGKPMIKHGDDVVLIDEFNPERGDGSSGYGVKAVTTTFGVTSGFRQKIELDKKTI